MTTIGCKASNLKEKMSKQERSYQYSVRPLAFLSFLNGVGILFAITSWPVEIFTNFPMPFVEPATMKRNLFSAVGIFHIMLGIGLFFRSRLMWHVFLSYLILGPTYLILGVVFDYFPQPVAQKHIIIFLCLLVSVGLGIGLYLVTRNAFIENDTNEG